ncbi:restriction endonuclease subunit S [Microcystis aeruginosa]|uniref:restriction endonuclease subunit S n=1 Tax=Microcystis aeruginosa TaxID=1126 RepID=UPI0018813AF5|nr:restriction endonuclease subunit S [Microcystis aeruginosa]MBE8993947.1 restriction endonuclease subunit S [Microcystis aeruginosa LEGE 91341]
MKLNKKYIALNNLIILQRGFDLPEIQRVIGNIPVVASTGIIGSHNIAKVKGPGVVIGRSGSIGGGQYVAGDFWPLNTTLWVKDFKEHNPRFIYYVLKNIDFSRFNFGTGVPTLNRNHIANIKVLAFDKSQEEKIADILSKYDDLIENNRRRIELLERSARLLYKEWFVRLRFPGHEHTPIIDGIPEGWKYLKLEEVISDIIDYRGKTPKKLGGDWSNSGIPALSALNVKNNQLINLDKCKFVNESLYEKWMKTELQKYDILMTSEAPLGELYYLTSEQKFCLSQRLYAIRANVDVIKPAMLFCTLLTPKTQAEIHSRETGTTVFGIRQSALREISILVPSIELQELATETLDSIFEQKEVLQKQNQKLKQARDILLPKLMNGEIEV